MANMTISTILALTGNAAALPATAIPTTDNSAGSFFNMIDSALKNVSSVQQTAVSAESSYASGLPGATLGNALVSSDRAEVAWNATVAVRNEVVSAYQSIMNMPL
ncbi:MAG: flagellar hook-basal body complex protein FliE [Acidocella sp.]|nr:flagellar hook-basal body complex protein FliE [Acidocella sp.]